MIKIENMENLIECKVCGKKSHRIYGAHLKSHGLTSVEYLNKYPGAPLMASSDLKNTIKNAGQHMKTEKYKRMFSEKIKGENNPMSRTKTSDLERKRNSPYSVEFYKFRYPEMTDDEIQNKISTFAKESIKDRISDTNLEYWLLKGFDEEDAKLKLKERQTTFTLDKCIEKYGEDRGIQVYTDRQKRWQTSLLENRNLKCGYSQVSQELFLSISKFYDNTSRFSNVYFAVKNKEYFISTSESFFVYDFVDIEYKRIIEYNGDKYHANPDKYNESDCPNPFRKDKTAKEIWKKDQKKNQVAESVGFEVLVIWDSEYKKSKSKVLERCIDFLKLKNNIK